MCFIRAIHNIHYGNWTDTIKIKTTEKKHVTFTILQIHFVFYSKIEYNYN